MIHRRLQNARCERGGATIEYAMGVALLLMVFAIAAMGLLIAGVTRQNASIGTVQKIAPCSSRIEGLYAANTPGVASKALCN